MRTAAEDLELITEAQSESLAERRAPGSYARRRAPRGRTRAPPLAA
jgi:hypothetical protein